jgi:hypothetical protein
MMVPWSVWSVWMWLRIPTCWWRVWRLLCKACLDKLAWKQTLSKLQGTHNTLWTTRVSAYTSQPIAMIMHATPHRQERDQGSPCQMQNDCPNRELRLYVNANKQLNQNFPDYKPLLSSISLLAVQANCFADFRSECHSWQWLLTLHFMRKSCGMCMDVHVY